MDYRKLGKTGLMVSEIGLGCEGFVDKDEAFCLALMEKAMENGVNIIDIYTSNPDVRRNIGKAIKGRREKMILQSHT